MGSDAPRSTEDVLRIQKQACHKSLHEAGEPLIVAGRGLRALAESETDTIRKLAFTETINQFDKALELIGRARVSVSTGP